VKAFIQRRTRVAIVLPFRTEFIGKHPLFDPDESIAQQKGERDTHGERAERAE